MSNFWHTRKPLVYRSNSTFISWQECLQAVATAELIQLEAGAVTTGGEFGTSGFNGGYLMAVDADAVQFLWNIPADCELNGQLYDVWIYPWISIAAGATALDDGVCTLEYKAMNGTTDTLIDPAVVLGVTDGALIAGAASTLSRATTGIKLDLSEATSITSATKMLLCKVGFTLTDFAANEMGVMGFEIVYNVPQT